MNDLTHDVIDLFLSSPTSEEEVEYQNTMWGKVNSLLRAASKDDESIDFGIDHAVESEPFDEEVANKFHQELHAYKDEGNAKDFRDFIKKFVIQVTAIGFDEEKGMLLLLEEAKHLLEIPPPSPGNEAELTIELLKVAVTKHCSCGGAGPFDDECCPACHVWHDLGVFTPDDTSGEETKPPPPPEPPPVRIFREGIEPKRAK